MNKERFLTNRISTINQVLNRHIVDIVEPSEDKEESGQMVSPQFSGDLRVAEAVDAGDDEGDDEDDVAVDPDVVGEIVVVLPVDLFQELHHIYYTWSHLELNLNLHRLLL